MHAARPRRHCPADEGPRRAPSPDLSAEWDAVSSTPLPMGCIVARREFVEEHPEAVDAFLDLYGDSISFMSDEGNRSEAAELVAKYGITANAQIAEAAIPSAISPCSPGGDAGHRPGLLRGPCTAPTPPLSAAASPMTACTICPDRLLRPLLPLAFWLVVWQLAALAVGQSFILPGPAAVLGTLIQLAGGTQFLADRPALPGPGPGRTAGRHSAGALIAALTCASRWADVLLCPRRPGHPGGASGLLHPLRPAVDPPWSGACGGLRPDGAAGGVGEREPGHPGDRPQAAGTGQSAPVLPPQDRPAGLSPFGAALLSQRSGHPLGLAWKSGVAAEVLCRPAWAVGTQIVQARDYLETPSLFAWTLVILLLSLTLEKLLSALLNRINRRWSP